MGAGKHCTMYWKPPTIKNYPAQSVKNVAVEKSQILPIGCMQRGAVCYKIVWHTVAAVIDTSRSTIRKIYNYTHSQMNRKLFSGFPGTVTSPVSSRVLICKSSALKPCFRFIFPVWLSCSQLVHEPVLYTSCIASCSETRWTLLVTQKHFSLHSFTNQQLLSTYHLPDSDGS